MEVNLPVSDDIKAVLLDAKQKSSACPVFSAIEQFASLRATDLALVKCWFKQNIPGTVNLNDLHAAIRDTKRDAYLRGSLRSDLPTIVVTDTDSAELSRKAVDALLKQGEDANLYVRSGSLVRVKKDEDGHAVVEAVHHRELSYALARSAIYYRCERGRDFKIPVPGAVVEDILGHVNWPFDPIEAVVSVPVMRPSGGLLDVPGYDPETRLYYAPPPDLNVPRIPEKPSVEDVRLAVEVIQRVLSDFPFVGKASLANLFGLLLTPICRPLVSGPVPLALIDAPKPGNGKSLLTEIFAIITTGTVQGFTTAPSNEDEWAKKITSLLLDGRSVIVIDNLSSRLDSAKLAAALTAQCWSERLLGESKQLNLPQRATWVATGNNITLGGDIPRRCYRIYLDAQCAEPWNGRSFKISNLREYVQEHRGELLAALLTIASGWYAAGKPKSDSPGLGSFEAWVEIIGSMLAFAKIDGFLTNLKEIQEADEEGAQWAAFLEAIYEATGGKEFTSPELHQQIMGNMDLRNLLPDGLAEGDNSSRRLGAALGARKNARYGGHDARVEKTGHYRDGLHLWRVCMTV
jgi:hypothetical protein